MSAVPTATAPVTTAEPRESSLSLLPAIPAHARAAFRSLRPAHDREDAEAEVAALARVRFVAVPAPTAVAAGRLAAPTVAAVRSKMARSHR